MFLSIDQVRGLGGILLVLLFAWALSSRRKDVPVRPVLMALGMQAMIGVTLFSVPLVRNALARMTDAVAALQAATLEGTQFAFGYLAGGPAPFETVAPNNAMVLALQVLPVIMVTSTLAALLWHWGVLERICTGLGYLLRRGLGLSGAAGLGASASVFLGMVEAPMVVRPYLQQMSRADILLLMSAAMATIAGTMMAVYTALLLPQVPEAAAHIIAASFMSAPGAIAIARILEPPGPDDRVLAHKPMPKIYQSTMDAFQRGVQDGLSVFLSVIAMIIVSVALIALIDMGLLAFGPLVDGEAISTGRILGWVFSPIMFALGVPWQDSAIAGQLLGTKLMLNEFLAFLDLTALPEDAIEPRTRIMMIYTLCGFANFSALAIMIGGLSAMCPDRRVDFLDLGLKSLLGGFMTNMMSAAIVGLLV